MSTVVTSPSTCFTRRVSFNNLHPDVTNLDDLGLHGGSVSGISGVNGGIANGSGAMPTNLDFGYGAALFNDISKAYTEFPKHKKKRLPDPPSKSILKIKTGFQQNFTNDTINYHEDVDFTDDNKVINLDDDDPLAPAAPRSRRKSYSDMSTEELMALDPQFQTTKSKTSDVDKFKFDSKKTYYLPSKRASVSGPDSAAAVAGRQSYPTSNENNYKSISLTVKHNEFDSFPIKRTLLTVISGRRHTWNSIDWLMASPSNVNPEGVCSNASNSESAIASSTSSNATSCPPSNNTCDSFLLDGDYLIVSSLIPLKLLKEYSKRPSSKKVSIDDYLYKKCENLLNYIANNETLKRNNLKLKITVEFVTDNEGETSTPYSRSAVGYKYMLQHLYKQYQPNLLILGNKSSNLNFKYPIKIKKQQERAEYLIKLSSYAIKYSSIPVILVGNTTKYHNTTGILPSFNSNISFRPLAGGAGASRPQKPSISFTEVESVSPRGTPPPVEKSRSNSQASTVESIESTESYVGEQTETVPEISLDSRVAELNSSMSEDRFRDLMALISDTSLEASQNYMMAINSKDDSLKVDSKIHTIYRAQTAGNGSTSISGVSRRMSADDATTQEKIYKVRSLISYSEDDELKNDKLRNKLKHQKSRQKSTSSVKSVELEKEKKKSLWQKLGLKKS